MSDLAEAREQHVRWDDGDCAGCPAGTPWPCDAARWQALADELVESLLHHRIIQTYGEQIEPEMVQHCGFRPSHRPDEDCPDCAALAKWEASK